MTEIDRENLLILCYQITENFVARGAFAIADNIIAVIVIGALGVTPCGTSFIPVLSKIVFPKQATPPSIPLVGRTTVSLALLIGVPSCSPKEVIKESPPLIVD